jgi:hypothetical protein
VIWHRHVGVVIVIPPVAFRVVLVTGGFGVLLSFVNMLSLARPDVLLLLFFSHTKENSPVERMKSRVAHYPHSAHQAGEGSRMSSSSSRLIAILVFVVLMIGTTVVVYIHGRSAPVSKQSAAEAAEVMEQLAHEQRVRQLAQRQKLLSEAKHLLRALDAADEQIEGAKRVFARFSQDGARRTYLNRNGGTPLSDDDTLLQQRGNVFPISRYETLRHAHRDLVQYHGSPAQPGPLALGEAATAVDAKEPTQEAAASGEDVDAAATIFMGLASHRQPLCSASISNIFRHAINPRRVYIGLVEIHAAGDAPCLPDGLTAGCQLGHFCVTDNIRVRDLEPSENKGLAYARYLSTLLYRGQDYVLLAAVPSFFSPRWDTQLLASYRSADNDAQQRRRADGGSDASANVAQILLSTSPESVDTSQTYPALPLDAAPLPPATTNVEGKASGMFWERTTMSSLCRANYDARGNGTTSESEFIATPGTPPLGVPRFFAVVQSERTACPHQPWATMKFLFANASLLREVPLDPYLLFIEREAEEDALYSARLWASGWDVYSPRRSVVFQWRNGETVSGSMSNDVPSGQYIAGKKATMMRMQYLLHALQQDSRDPLVPDDVVLQEVIAEASSYGVRWGTTTLVSKERDAKWNAASVEGRWIPRDDRNLERWYRYAGLNPSKYAATKEWCRADEASRS